MGIQMFTPVYEKPPKFAIPRNYVGVLRFGWAFNWTVVSGPQPYVFEEHVFGGVEIILSFKSSFWAWSSNVYTLDYIIDDCYGLAPDHVTQINIGDLHLDVGTDFNHRQPTLAFSSPPFTQYEDFVLPVDPGSHWNEPLIPPFSP
jgi:hypothetical protein